MIIKVTKTTIYIRKGPQGEKICTFYWLSGKRTFKMTTELTAEDFKNLADRKITKIEVKDETKTDAEHPSIPISIPVENLIKFN